MKSDEKPISEIINSMLDLYKLKNGMDITRLNESWESIMGKTIAKHTDKLVLRDNVLHIHVNSAALRQELAMNRARITDLINERMGQGTVKEVKIF